MLAPGMPGQTASTSQQMLSKWDAWGLGLRTMLRGVERACQTASTFREQKECWEDVETKFKRNHTLLNMSQQLSKQMLTECWDKFWDRVTRAYDANARVFTPMISQPRSQNPRYPYSWTSGSTAHVFDSMFQQRDASKGCQDSWTSGLTAHVRRITLSRGPCSPFLPLDKGSEDSGNEIDDKHKLKVTYAGAVPLNFDHIASWESNMADA